MSPTSLTSSILDSFHRLLPRAHNCLARRAQGVADTVEDASVGARCRSCEQQAHQGQGEQVARHGGKSEGSEQRGSD